MSPPALDVGSTGTPVSISPLTVDGIAALRAKGSKMPLGVAAGSSSDMFKSPACFAKPKAKRWDHVISLESRSRKSSTLKGAAKYMKNPGLISLGGGLPSADYFPFEHIDFKVPKVPQFSPEETKETGVLLKATKNDIREGKSLYDLEICLNYGQATGSAQMIRWVTEHTELIHNPPYSDWQCCLTPGSTAAWDSTLRLFCERGDYILMEEYTFVSALETALPLGVKGLPVGMDEEGLRPDALDEILSNWDETARGARKPFLLYTIPTGQNPTGATQSLERRKAVYQVAQKHGVYIIEDEPYYFLQMQPYAGAEGKAVPPPANHDEFLKSLVPSYLSIDVDGRVCRLESFSKVISPGSRVGWLVASEQIIERFTRQFEVSTQNPSGFSQIALYKLLDEQWGHAGYLDWLIHLRLEYTNRRDSLIHACEKYFPTDIVSWIPPAAGMFHWIEVDWRKHPKIASKTHDEIEEAIFMAAVERGVLVSRGSWFKADGSVKEEKMFFRATFATASEEQIFQAISRLADAVKQEFGL